MLFHAESRILRFSKEWNFRKKSRVILMKSELTDSQFCLSLLYVRFKGATMANLKMAEKRNLEQLLEMGGG
jgi:hypothetical protein